MTTLIALFLLFRKWILKSCVFISIYEIKRTIHGPFGFYLFVIGVATIFQRGVHTVSKWVYSFVWTFSSWNVMAFSPPVLGCFVKKGLQKGGSRALQDPPWIRLCFSCCKYLSLVCFVHSWEILAALKDKKIVSPRGHEISSTCIRFWPNPISSAVNVREQN